MDCSGFVSWTFNQIDTNNEYDANAYNFNQTYNFKTIELGTKLITGDTIAWDTHIIMVVGNVGNRSYVIVESAPNVIRLGVAYYTGATSSEVEEARRIANKYNKLIGGNEISGEKLNCYNINSRLTREVVTTEAAIGLDGLPIINIDGTPVVNEITSTKEVLTLGRFNNWEQVEDIGAENRLEKVYKELPSIYKTRM